MLTDGEALLNRGLLLRRLKEFGISGTSWWKGLDHFADWRNTNLLGPQQIPTEFVDYLLYTASTKPKNAIEIGVSFGGTALFSFAFFKALDPDFEYHCVDIDNSLKLSKKILKMLPLSLHIPNTSDDLAGTVFDVVFIDGNHSYSWAKRDYENLGKHAAKICAFHDINAKEYIPEGGGAFKFWRELRATVAREAPMIDFSHAVPGPGVSSDGLWMGNGIVDFSRKHEAV